MSSIPDDIFYFSSATLEEMHRYYKGIYYDAKGELQTHEIRVFEDCENILAWLKAHGIDPFVE